MKQRLEALFAQHLHIHTPLRELTKLHGDASARSYYRARCENGASYIIMQLPEGKASVSEEITNFKGEHAELPFINIAHFLASCGLPVPKIYHYSAADHLMILEDVGEKTMGDFIADGDTASIRCWYEKAVKLLAHLQHATAGKPRESSVALQRSFDATLLNWEFDHFLEYGLQKRGVAVADADVEIFTRETRNMTKAIEALPRALTHRDFQSRNLMVRDGELVLIDFQDALMGPRIYDLVALTRDSYVVLPPQLVQELLTQYAEQSGAKPMDVQREYRLVTVQRKLKDAGRFVYIDQVKKNPRFLPYIPTSLSYVREALQQLPEHRSLYEMLQHALPEWR